MGLFSGNITQLENALNYSSLRHKVVAQNIANAEVPNYKGKDLSFKKVLENVNQHDFNAYRTDARHFQIKVNSGQLPLFTKRNMQYHDNGNNVDMDKEMADLASNQIYYNALIERLNGKFSTLQNVLKGGR